MDSFASQLLSHTNVLFSADMSPMLLKNILFQFATFLFTTIASNCSCQTNTHHWLQFKQICLTKSSSTILITNFYNFENFHKSSQFAHHYQYCFDTIFDQNHLDDRILQEAIHRNYKYKKLLSVFDFTTLSTDLLSTVFEQTLPRLQDLYIGCVECLPFWLLFGPSTSYEALLRISEQLLPHTNNTFRLVLISIDRLEGSNIWINPAIHLRATLDGCFRHPHLFVPRNRSQAARLDHKARHCDLRNSELRVSVEQSPPFCLLQDTNSALNQTVALQSQTWEGEILFFLESRYHFRSRLIDTQQLWNPQYNHSARRWDGLIGQVYSQQVDFGICAVTRNLDRTRYVDFTHFTAFDYLTFVTPKPKLASRGWIAAQPFKLTIWILLLACLLALSLVIYYFQIFSNSFANQNLQNGIHFDIGRQLEAKQQTQMDFLIQIFSVMFSTILNQSNKFSRFNGFTSTRLIVGVWILCALIFTNSYSGVLYSILAVPEMETPVDTIDQMMLYIERPPIKTLYTSPLYIYSFRDLATTSDNAVYYRLGEYIRNFKVKLGKSFGQNNDSSFLWQPKPIFLIIQTKFFFITLEKYYSGYFHLAKENINFDTLGIVVPKRSPLLLPFNIAIQQMFEMGILEKLERNIYRNGSITGGSISHWFHNNAMPQHPSKQDKSNSFSLEDLHSIGSIWIIGISVATCVFWVEFLQATYANINLFNSAKIHKKCLQLNRTRRAKSCPANVCQY